MFLRDHFGTSLSDATTEPTGMLDVRTSKRGAARMAAVPGAYLLM